MRSLVSCRGNSLASIAVGLSFLLLVCLSSINSLATGIVGRGPRVLILYPYDERLPATAIAGETARTRLLEATQGKIDLFSEFLDLARFREEGHIANMARYLAAKYASVRPDVVIALGAESVSFIVANRKTIAPDARIVYAGISSVEAAGMHLPDDLFGALTEFDITKTVAMAHGLQPKARQLVVVAGSGQFDKTWLDAAKRDLAKIGAPYETTYLTDLTIDEFVKRVSELPRDSILLILSFFKDSTGRNFVPREAVEQIARAATAPSYGPYSTYIGHGIVGTSTFTFEAMGSEVADLALAAIANKPIADVIVPQTYLADARELKRWGLAESRLPPGTVLSLQEKSLWQEHHVAILLAFAIVTVQALAIGALLMERRRRASAEQLPAAVSSRSYISTSRRLPARCRHRSPMSSTSPSARSATTQGLPSSS